MKKFLIYILIVGLLGGLSSITMQDTGKSRLNSSAGTVMSTVGVGVAYADSLGDPHPPPPPPPIPK